MAYLFTLPHFFEVSLLLALAFVALKMWEINSKRHTFISNFISRGDKYILKFLHRTHGKIEQNKQKTIFFVLVHLPERIEKFFIMLKARAHDKYFEMAGKVRGKHSISHSDNVSQFMRSISPQHETK